MAKLTQVEIFSLETMSKIFSKVSRTSCLNSNSSFETLKI